MDRGFLALPRILLLRDNKSRAAWTPSILHYARAIRQGVGFHAGWMDD